MCRIHLLAEGRRLSVIASSDGRSRTQERSGTDAEKGKKMWTFAVFRVESRRIADAFALLFGKRDVCRMMMMLTMKKVV